VVAQEPVMPTQQQREQETVRKLANTVAELAAAPENAAICKRWRDVNSMRRPDRAPVYCRPVGCWPELLSPDTLVCGDPFLRGMEHGFRQILVKHDIGDDTPIASYFAVSAVFRREPANTYGLDVSRENSDTPGGAWAYDPPLKTELDFDRLVLPRFAYDADETRRRSERAAETLDGIMPVHTVCGPPLTLTLGNPAADLRGLNQMMLDMAVQPELMHRLMRHLRDAVLGAMDDVAAAGLLTPNNTGPMTCSDPIGKPVSDGKTGYQNMWGNANSQEFDQVSPGMWKEFCLNYQKPIFERFGLVAYGCCEDLTHKIDGILTIPNLRMFVSSAWTDLDTVIEKVGDRHVIMWRQKASAVVFPDDISAVRQHLRDGMRRLKGCHVQIVLRELQTLAGHPDRLHVWTRLAKEAAAQ